MPKQLKELRIFNQGTHSAPSSTDIPDEAPVYSINIDPITTEGVLRGCNDHSKILQEESAPEYFVTILGSETYNYYHPVAGLYIPFQIFPRGDVITSVITVNGIVHTYTKELNTVVNDALLLENNSFFDSLSAYLESIPGISSVSKVLQNITVDGYEAENENNDNEYLIKSNLDIKLDSNVDTFAIKVTSAQGANVELIDNSEYLSLNATEMETFNDKQEENIAFYSVSTDEDGNTENRMKVVEDIHGKKTVIQSHTEASETNEDQTVYYDIPNSPDDVSLTKKNAEVYIGTGNKEHSKSKWFGKIKHKQFGVMYDHYALEDSELKPIGEGQGVFNITGLDFSWSNGSENKNALFGYSEGSYYMYAVYNGSTENEKGRQYQSLSRLSFKPWSISSSKYLDSKLYNQDITFFGESVASSDNPAHDRYFWVGEKESSKIHIVRAFWDEDNPTLFDVSVVKTFTLTFSSDYPIIGETIERDIDPPPTGSYITDLLEIEGTSNVSGHATTLLYILFRQANPFTYDQEYIYVANIEDSVLGQSRWIENNANNTNNNEDIPSSGDGLGTIRPHPISFPTKKLYKESAWDLGANSSFSIYSDQHTFKTSLGSQSYDTSEGTWSARSNKIYYRKSDPFGNLASESWNKITGRNFQYSADNTEIHLGKDNGWDGDKDLSITPHRNGLVRLDDNKIGLIAQLSGSWVKNAGAIKGALTRERWPKRWYYIYPSENAEVVNYNEVVMFQLNPFNYGAKGTSVPNTKSAGDNAFHWSGSFGWDNGMLTNLDAVRNGSATHASNVKGHYSDIYLFKDSGSASSQSNSSEVQSLPDDVDDIYGITRRIITTGSGIGKNDIDFSFKALDGTNTVLGRWNVGLRQDTTYDGDGLYSLRPIDEAAVDGFSVDSQADYSYKPTKLTGLGSSYFVSWEDSNNTMYFLNATQGSYFSAFAKLKSDSSGFEDTGNYTDGGLGGKYYKLDASELDYGLTFINGEVASDGNFKNNNIYYYKITYLFDGYQESPLNNFYFKYEPTGNDYNSVNIKIRLSKPPKRATHIVIYRKNNVQDFYRMVTEVSLEKGWSYISSDDQYFKLIVDDGKLSATYEAITGMPETIQNTNVNYKLSTVAGGYLIVGNCWHKEIKNGENFIFRSQPGNFSVFNWSSDFLILPNEPTALVYYANRLYAFDKSNMYKIDINNMVIEDIHEGVGCLSEQSSVITDYGLFFCDETNIYKHDGSNATPIATDILTSDYIDSNNSPWQDIIHEYPPSVSYDSEKQNVLFAFKDSGKNPSKSASWNYNIPRNRWDLMEIPEPKSLVRTSLGEILLSDGEKLYNINRSEGRKSFDWTSKKLDFGTSTQLKTFKKIIIRSIGSVADINESDIYIIVDGNEIAISELTTESSKTTSNVLHKKMKSSHKKGYTFEIKIKDQGAKIDSIAIVYLQKSVR